MALVLGIDTGGTFTDAVLFDEAKGVVAKTKTLTVHGEPSASIARAMDTVMARTGCPARHIALVSVSTTLATNALVEGRGGRVCTLMIGFERNSLGRGGLGDALGQDPVYFIQGGHDPSGTPQAPLDLDAIDRAAMAHLADCEAFAIIGYFAARNPEHELAARDSIQKICSLPVTCGHELSARLDGPRRAVTTLLNARLISMITDLIGATEQVMHAHAIKAPLMLVRGDGSLVAADFARTRPIETILSGPAASLIGAAYLSGLDNAMVADIGGTTTDIAVLQNGRPVLNADGALVAGFRTMVQAIDMRTHGLGGDSEVSVIQGGPDPQIGLGPRRCVPISLLAHMHPEHVHDVLDRQLRAPRAGAEDARFAVCAGRSDTVPPGLKPAERTLFTQIAQGKAVPVDLLSQTAQQRASLARLVQRGVVRIAGFTPSDAAHLTGQHTGWDGLAAEKAARLIARQRDAYDRPLAATAHALAQNVIKALKRRSAEIILDTALASDGVPGDTPSRTALGAAALDGHSGAARLSMGLALPLVGLGASAPVYYPQIAQMLGTASVIPDHADVANAIGAVVGRVDIRQEATISQPQEGVFRIHFSGTPEDCTTLEGAIACAREKLGAILHAQAQDAGAEQIELHTHWHPQIAAIEGREVFLEGRLEMRATGRPRLGGSSPPGANGSGQRAL